MKIEQISHNFEPVVITIQTAKEYALFVQMVRTASNNVLAESSLEEFIFETERLIECLEDE